jgi:histidinol-phosphate aminotransferase
VIEMTDASNPLVEPSPLVQGLEPYRPPRFVAPIDLRLDANEGAPPPAELLEEVAAAGPEAICHYPNPAALEELLAGRLGVDAERVLVTAGADDAIERIMRSVLAPGREMVLPVPTFEMIPRYARLTGCTPVEVEWSDGPFPLERMVEAIGERTALVVLVTPNSPTGLAATAADLRALSAAAPNALLMVDLAYTEFADEDLTGAALELPNAVVTRTLSKAWGLAGLRVGYAAGPTWAIDWLRAAGHPFAVSVPSLAIAEARLRGGEADVIRFAGRVREERAMLTEQLERLGARPLPSQTNFVFARLSDAPWVREALAGLGVAVRGFPPQMTALADGLRITLPGEPTDFERLSKGLAAALDPQAILFDMDDTLADATESYRGATVATAASYGVEITFDDITAAKAAGNANNDWDLTWRMVRERGVEADLEEVTARFEDLYQGTGGQPGLRSRETLLVERGSLERLSGRVKLGVVTGRPRRDAEAFLNEQGIADLFGVLVTMEDGPPKPDPAPVRTALDRLGVERAWLVGDTPDDVRASRGAGVVPLGVVAPADDPTAARGALLAAGAARVLDKLEDIEELLR